MRYAKMSLLLVLANGVMTRLAKANHDVKLALTESCLNMHDQCMKSAWKCLENCSETASGRAYKLICLNPEQQKKTFI